MHFEHDAIDTSGGGKRPLPENRQAIVSLPQDFLIDVLEGCRELCGFPSDARIVGLATNFSCRSIEIIVESETFAPVPQGECLPHIGTFLELPRRAEKIEGVQEGKEPHRQYFYVSERAERIETPDGNVKFREFL